MDYKRTFYQICQPISDDIYLCTNFNNDSHILLSKEVYSLYINNTGLLTLQNNYPDIFNRLLSNNFLIKKEVDEKSLVYLSRQNEIENRELYHIVINPTLDCNLSCWYCYENRVHQSSMDINIANAILKNLEIHFNHYPYSYLKISFFGGEPFLRPLIMRHIIKNANLFCHKNNIKLLLDFTTNGTLCSSSIIDFLKDYNCTFQITLDGNKEQHNKIKYVKNRKIDTFELTLNNIYKIEKDIKNSHVSVRINFDKDTLNNFDSILESLNKLDRSKTKVILKRVWQVSSDDIDKSTIFKSLEKLFTNNFIVDYYSQGGICFADRVNQVLINYDGNVFKCTTISKFDKENALGYLDKNTGIIHWNKEKSKYIGKQNMAKICENCKMLPSCGGFCQKKLESNQDQSCFLSASDISMEEYALIQFQISLIKEKYENIF